MTTDDLIVQLRSSAISVEVLEACKPHLEQVPSIPRAAACMPSMHACSLCVLAWENKAALGFRN